MTPDEERRQYDCRLLDIVGLTEDALTKYPHQFSGGQRQTYRCSESCGN